MAVGAGFNWFIAAGFVDRPTRPSAWRKSGRFLRAPLRRQEGCTRWCRAGGAVAGRCCKKPNGQPQRGAGPKQPSDGSGGRCGLLRGRIAESRRKGIGTGEGCLPGLGQAGAVEKEIGQAIGVGHGAMIARRKSSCGRINPILNPSHCLYPNKNFLDRLLPAGALAAFTPCGQGRDCCHPRPKAKLPPSTSLLPLQTAMARRSLCATLPAGRAGFDHDGAAGQSLGPCAAVVH